MPSINIINPFGHYGILVKGYIITGDRVYRQSKYYGDKGKGTYDIPVRLEELWALSPTYDEINGSSGSGYKIVTYYGKKGLYYITTWESKIIKSNPDNSNFEIGYKPGYFRKIFIQLNNEPSEPTERYASITATDNTVTVEGGFIMPPYYDFLQIEYFTNAGIHVHVAARKNGVSDKILHGLLYLGHWSGKLIYDGIWEVGDAYILKLENKYELRLRYNAWEPVFAKDWVKAKSMILEHSSCITSENPKLEQIEREITVGKEKDKLHFW